MHHKSCDQAAFQLMHLHSFTTCVVRLKQVEEIYNCNGATCARLVMQYATCSTQSLVTCIKPLPSYVASYAELEQCQFSRPLLNEK